MPDLIECPDYLVNVIFHKMALQLIAIFLHSQERPHGAAVAGGGQADAANREGTHAIDRFVQRFVGVPNYDQIGVTPIERGRDFLMV